MIVQTCTAVRLATRPRRGGPRVQRSTGSSSARRRRAALAAPRDREANVTGPSAHDLDPVQAPAAECAVVAGRGEVDGAVVGGRLEEDRPELALRAAVAGREVVAGAHDPHGQAAGPQRHLPGADELRRRPELARPGLADAPAVDPDGIGPV